MIKVAFCDDEAKILEDLSQKVLSEFKNNECEIDLYTTESSMELLEYLKENSVDILFLDIDMPGMSGLELAKRYKDKIIGIVFVTNRDDLVFEAYNTTNTLGFVRKSEIEYDLSLVLDRLQRDLQNTHYLTVKSGSVLKRINYSEILFVEKMAHNVILHTLSDDIAMRKTIAEVEELLANSGFVRTHVGYIVNMVHIKLIDAKEVILLNGKMVPISRQNVKLVKDKFLKWSVMLNE